MPHKALFPQPQNLLRPTEPGDLCICELKSACFSLRICFGNHISLWWGHWSTFFGHTYAPSELWVIFLPLERFQKQDELAGNTLKRSTHLLRVGMRSLPTLHAQRDSEQIAAWKGGWEAFDARAMWRDELSHWFLLACIKGIEESTKGNRVSGNWTSHRKEKQMNKPILVVIKWKKENWNIERGDAWERRCHWFKNRDHGQEPSPVPHIPRHSRLPLRGRQLQRALTYSRLEFNPWYLLWSPEPH